MSAPIGHGRRRMLALAATATATTVTSGWSGAGLWMPFDDRRLLDCISRELGIAQQLPFRQLAERLRLNVDTVLVEPLLRSAAQRLRTFIGAALQTARATVPSLIRDDFTTGRTLAVHGVVFSHTEIALLLAVSDQMAAGAD